MKVNIIKTHWKYPLGEVDLELQTANYLIRVGVAERVRDIVTFEKEEIPAAKEKKENKTNNVPTAKKKKQ